MKVGKVFFYKTRKGIIMWVMLLILLFALESVGQTAQDYDGNTYNTVAIGKQVWLRENLKSLHYSDGTIIPGVVAYNNSDSLRDIYGLLYTWNAAMKGTTAPKTQGVCPCGWHVPSHEEWVVLENYLGGASVAGGKMKEAGTSHWFSPNTGADNSSGFTALPAGEYDAYYSPNVFRLLNDCAVFWTSTQVSSSMARERYIQYSSGASKIYDWYKVMKYSIRCVKDTIRADFIGSKLEGYQPLEVQFNDLSIPANCITSWSWDFNNDGIEDSHEKKPLWVYSEPGLYSVRLIVSVGAELDTMIRSEYIRVFRLFGEIPVAYTIGWNLVSSPVHSFQPVTLPSLFNYMGYYFRSDTMENGRGYWAKPGPSQTYSGRYIFEGQIEVNPRWNIIGSISEPVAVANISSDPSGIVTSNFWGYSRDSGYTIADTIMPGKGYWVKAGSAGKLNLAAGQMVSSKNKVVIQSGGEPPPPPPGSGVQTNQEPLEYNLKQNYPNPFNPSTRIEYSMPERGYVRLQVFNILGEAVMTVVDEYQDAGLYSYDMDFSHLPGGVYYYKIITNEYEKVKKLVYIK